MTIGMWRGLRAYAKLCGAETRAPVGGARVHRHPHRRGPGRSARFLRGAGAGLLLAFQAACTSLEGPDYGVFDANEDFNRQSYEFSEAVDEHAMAPIARGYQSIAPDLVETGISNFFGNLRSLDSSANGFLQGRPKRGATDSLRFILNTTVGLGGLFDVATPAGLYHQEEDFGQTLAVWGWRKSRYVYVPLVGPSTVRDLPVLVIRGILPRLVLGDIHNLGISGLDVVSARAGALDLTETRDASALDAYVFTREAYVQRREFLIFDGNPPLDDFDDFFDEFEDDEFGDEDGDGFDAAR